MRRLLIAALPLVIALVSLTGSAASGSQGSAKIAFVSTRDGSSDIFVADFDGSNPRNLTDNDEPEDDPAWSPDGQQILFTRFIDADGETYKGEIFVMNADGTDQRNLTNTGRCAELEPAWSPDGRTIAYRSISNGMDCRNHGIYLMNVDGGNVREARLGGPLGGAEPAWSPDGSKIAFMALGAGDDIFVGSPGNSDAVNLTYSDNSRGEYHPEWSPDGRAIVFVSTRNVMQQIFTMNSDGTNEIALPSDYDFDDTPTWSGDGSTILFRHKFDIYAMNRDGADIRPLIAGDFAEEDPDWYGPGAPPPGPTASPTPSSTPSSPPTSKPTPTAIPSPTPTGAPTPAGVPAFGGELTRSSFPGVIYTLLAASLILLGVLTAIASRRRS